MKFTLSWLKDHLDSEATLEQIVAKLSAIGLEVEGVENPGAALAPFRIARVVSAAPHPQADKLQVLMVDAGPDYNGGQPVQVVCGAPNAEAYMYGVFGPPGAYVPGAGITLGEAKIRGVESFGMMCSERELGLGEGHEGIISLSASSPVPVQGMSYVDYAGLDDPVIEAAVTPNRPDCMGVYGIARDLAAAGLGRLREWNGVNHPALLHDLATTGQPYAGEDDGAAAAPEVRSDDPDCPIFLAQRIEGVRNGASPEWMQRRLRAIGQRPISALVDVTNYLMFDLGRPLHVYDEEKLNGPLVARKARPGETVEALNGKAYTLDAGMTVIADDAAVHDIGGIMGGAHSGAGAATTNVVVECAWFDPLSIARTGRALNLTSDARARFERGVDPGIMYDALLAATKLMQRICGGRRSEPAGTDSWWERSGTLGGKPPIAFDPGLVLRLGGVDVARTRQAAILDALGFAVLDGEDQPIVIDEDGLAIVGETPRRPLDDVVGPVWTVAAPGWRPDIEGPADIVEEVVRIHGLDAVPSTPLPRTAAVALPTATPEQARERRLRRAAAARGLAEAVTWSFLPSAQAAAFAAEGTAPWTLANPISEDMKAMRPSLLPGLLSAARRNLDRGAAGSRAFEIGRRYLRAGDGTSDERASLAVVLAGEKLPRGWASGKAQAFDAYDAKAEALALLAEAGAPVDNLQVMGEAGDQFHPGQSGTLRLGPKTVLARFGMLHPALLKQFDIAVPVAAAELFLDAIPQRRSGGFARAAYAPPALQAVTRDFAFLVPADLPAGDLLRAVRGADKAAIVGARVFDDFRGAGVPEGHKSVAIEVTLQPGDKSFTDAELKTAADKVTAAAGKLGAQLRG
ncbi:phenylalanine--tRNA ligase subunit beta [Parablastomonas sp. CN1-191]|uniref:phenylalanine--tRNA ligase subunit beta n=1 Tax=Parablastomonas sp. CN1-191 TaxID=3400908 RepID=UPI003BF87C44